MKFAGASKSLFMKHKLGSIMKVIDCNRFF